MHDTLTHQLATNEQRHTCNLLAHEGKIAAVKYVQDRLDLRLAEAIRVVHQLSGSMAGANLDLERPFGTSRKSGNPLLLGIPTLFLLLSAGFLSVSFLIWNDHQDLAARGVMTEARVVALHSTGKGGAPEFEYIWEGKIHSWKSNISSQPSLYRAGDEVKVFVDPNAPEDILVDDLLHQWLLIVIFGAIGVGLSLAAVIACYVIKATSL